MQQLHHLNMGPEVGWQDRRTMSTDNQKQAPIQFGIEKDAFQYVKVRLLDLRVNVTTKHEMSHVIAYRYSAY